jgi:hypothetical protein
MSHNRGESVLSSPPAAPIRLLDLSLIVEGAVAVLETLVEGGTPRVASKSDWEPIGDVDGDGVIESPAIAYPEVACPLGVFYPYPANGDGSTAFAGFSGEGVEPVDGQSIFVDMNRNGVWDFRETPTGAWRRLGLLGPRDTLTQARYIQCVTGAAQRLRAEGFFTAATAERYVRDARTRDLTPSAQNGGSP